MRVGRWMLSMVVVGALGPSASLASMPLEHSGWYWSDPLPQGDALHGVEFAGNHGYAIDGNGLVLRSEDAGETWEGAYVDGGASMIRAVDARTAIVSADCRLSVSEDGGRSFARVAMTCPGDTAIASFSFPTRDVGFVVRTDGSIEKLVRTTPRSALADVPDPPPPAALRAGGSGEPTDLVFTSPTTGTVITADGEIYHTDNPDTGWTRVHHGAPQLNGLHFVTADVGYAVGDERYIVRTNDGGRTWSPPLATTTLSADIDLTSIRCATAEQCLLTQAFGNGILRTTDGGATFTTVEPADHDIEAVAFASATRVIAVGLQGLIAVSDDAGATYRTVTTDRDVGSIDAVSDAVAFAASPLMRTTDAGQSWELLDPPAQRRDLVYEFATPDVGYAFDGRPAYHRTRDGGESWTTIRPRPAAPPEAIVAPNARLVLLIGPRGIRRSADGGETWAAVDHPLVAGRKLGSADVAGRAVVVRGPRRLLMGVDGGRRWRRLAPLPGRRSVAAFDFVSRSVGFATGAGHPARRVWATRDGGRSWREVVSAATNAAFDIRFGSATSGWLLLDATAGEDVGEADAIGLLRTTDGGATWRPQLRHRDLESLAVGSAGTAFSMAYDLRKVFATRNGGDRGQTTRLTLRTRRTSLDRPGAVAVRGTLAPARGGEKVTIKYRGPGTRPPRADSENGPRPATADPLWHYATRRVGPDGSFSLRRRVPRGVTFFVARFDGDTRLRSAGSRALAVRVRP